MGKLISFFGALADLIVIEIPVPIKIFKTYCKTKLLKNQGKKVRGAPMDAHNTNHQINQQTKQIFTIQSWF